MAKTMLPNGAGLISLVPDAATGRTVARAQNYCIEWLAGPGQAAAVASNTESIVLLCRGAAMLADERRQTAMEGPSLAIMPAGSATVSLTTGGPVLVLSTDRTDLAAAGGEPDPRVAPVGTPFVRKTPLDGPLVVAFDDLANPSGNSRIRFVQSATMSVNLVRYAGARDTKTLSPHAHADIEQGTLAVFGRYVHHLRTPWVPDKSQWRDDVHVEADAGTLLLIPPELIHTTEGIGEDTHLLLDIFAPPRRDFIAKGMIGNAGDYLDPRTAADGRHD